MPTELKVQPPKDALRLFEGKELLLTSSWQNLWQEEHARAFTAANLARLDLLHEIHGALSQAIREGLDYRAFAKLIVPKLQQAGWWSQPVPEGKPLSPSRLKLIYDTNMRNSYMAAKWGRIQRLKGRRPFLRYNTMKDSRVRPTHLAWEGILLPVDHLFWETHFPQNGWRCRCDVESLSQEDMDAGGLSVTPDEALPKGSKIFTNTSTGEILNVPSGIDPGWAYNPGAAGQRAVQLGRTVGDKLMAAHPDAAAQAAQAAGDAFADPLQARLKAWAEQLQDGTLKPTGHQVTVGTLSPRVLEGLKELAALEPETAAITLSDREFLHMLRPAKAGRGAAWPVNQLLELPRLLNAPDGVYWDASENALLYAWDIKDQTAKAVIRVNYRVKSEGQKLKTNLIKTTGMTHPGNLETMTRIL